VKEPEKYELLETEISHFARALGHPARIAILLAMAKKGNSVEGEIVEIPQLSRATVIQHLRELKRAGLINGKIFGSKAVYKIDFDNLKKFFNSFDTFMSQTLPDDVEKG
jgi:ArsR family transcriptional regulator, arsenate/arsenite/antimonite-responsive transcriptional repressor